MAQHHAQPVDLVHRIKQEIEQLSDQQTEALKTATYVGMSDGEAKEYEHRGDRMNDLIKQLRLLQGRR
jgi:hypothetical protein